MHTFEAQANRPDVLGLGTNQATIPELFKTMRSPAEDASDSKGRGKQFFRYAETVKQQRGIELNIGVQTAARFPLSENSEGDLFNFPRERIKIPIAFACVEFFSGGSKHIRARISHAIDAMTEAHQPLAMRQLCKDDFFRAIWCADFKHHIERWTRGTAV